MNHAPHGAPVEVLAFFLPQFHPIPENDAWWGTGFTEWRNVVQARPRFQSHWQPHLPADLGFVDLRSMEVLSEQARLATEFGISGFVFYHYWFGGRQLLQRPLEKILADEHWPGRFCLCWANESWSKVWDGREHEVLVRQVYSQEDDTLHARHIIEVMRDSRYIRVDGRPLFVVYRPGAHPALREFCDKVRENGRMTLGAAPLILGLRSGFDDAGRPSWAHAVDAVVAFQPNHQHFVLADTRARLMAGAQRVLPATTYQWLKRRGSAVKRVDYAATARHIVASWESTAPAVLPCVFPSWDNTPRRQTPTVIQNLEAGAFQRFASAAVAHLRRSRVEPSVLFVNAWNEWAEGCHLEPDLRLGLRFLSELREALVGGRAGTGDS